MKAYFMRVSSGRRAAASNSSSHSLGIGSSSPFMEALYVRYGSNQSQLTSDEGCVSLAAICKDPRSIGARGFLLWARQYKSQPITPPAACAIVPLFLTPPKPQIMLDPPLIVRSSRLAGFVSKLSA